MPNAKSLILDLLSTLRGRSMPVSALVASGEVFGLSSESVRVTLMRLVRRGLVERAGLGRYRLSRKAAPVQSQVASWTLLEERVNPQWKANWIGVHTGALGRTGRTQVRRRERAFRLLGFAELVDDLWIRPDNLAGGVGFVRRRLHELGLDPAAPVFSIAEMDAADEARARTLWNADALAAGYRETRRALAGSRHRVRTMPLQEALVESFTVGGRALRQIVLDPLLPEPLVKTAERRALVEELKSYDQQGRERWREFLARFGGPQLQEPLGYRAA
jgi:phenylacetic acid degradation operon negative regulatory protein